MGEDETPGLDASGCQGGEELPIRTGSVRAYVKQGPGGQGRRRRLSGCSESLGVGIGQTNHTSISAPSGLMGSWNVRLRSARLRGAQFLRKDATKIPRVNRLSEERLVKTEAFATSLVGIIKSIPNAEHLVAVDQGATALLTLFQLTRQLAAVGEDLPGQGQQMGINWRRLACVCRPCLLGASGHDRVLG
jgi:hypothetical protein